MYSRSRRNVPIYIGMSVIGILLLGLYILSVYNKKNIKKIRDSLDKQQKRMKYKGYPVYPEYNNVYQKIHPEDRLIYPDPTTVDNYQTVVDNYPEKSLFCSTERPQVARVDRRSQGYVPSLYQDTSDIPIFQTYTRSSVNNAFQSGRYQRQS